MSPTQATFVDDSYTLQNRCAQCGHRLYWTITPHIVYYGRLGLDLAIAPGITSYPDLTKAGFPSYLDQQRAGPDAVIDFDSSYSNLFDQCCVDTHFSAHAVHLLFRTSWVKGTHSI